MPHEHQRNAGVAAPPVDGGLIADAGPVAQFVNIGAGADTTAFFLAVRPLGLLGPNTPQDFPILYFCMLRRASRLDAMYIQLCWLHARTWTSYPTLQRCAAPVWWSFSIANSLFMAKVALYLRESFLFAVCSRSSI